MITTMETPPTAALTLSPQLPEAVSRRGLDEFGWRTLTNSLFPGARPESVLMVVDYCRARKLDPLKKPCHIVPIRVKDAGGQWVTRDVVMPGIYEYRITAHRTGLYLGHSKPEYGANLTIVGVEAPEWCEMTMYRWHRESNRVVEFPVQLFFAEVVATKQDGKANERWSKAPTQMLTKSTEAAGLREAFPEEFGGEQTAEEMDGRTIDVTPTPSGAPVIQMPQRQSEPRADGAAASIPLSKSGDAGSSPAQPATTLAAVPLKTDEPAAEELPQAADKLTKVTKKGPANNGSHWWLVETQRGTQAYTWSKTIGAQLEAFFMEGTPIEIETEQDKRGDHKVTEIRKFDPFYGGGRTPGEEG